jgi:hypothetical protein
MDNPTLAYTSSGVEQVVILDRAILAAKRFNEANQHRDGSGEWKDWA